MAVGYGHQPCLLKYLITLNMKNPHCGIVAVGSGRGSVGRGVEATYLCPLSDVQSLAILSA